MNYKLVPQYDRIAIVRNPKVTRYGSIEIPAAQQKDQFIGRVLAVGQGVIGSDGAFHKTHYERGDIVLFGRYAGADIESFYLTTSDGLEIFFIKETDIYAKLEEVRAGETDVPLVVATDPHG